MRLLPQPTDIILSQPPRSVNRFPREIYREIYGSAAKATKADFLSPRRTAAAFSLALARLPAVGGKGEAGRRAYRPGDPKDLERRHQSPNIRRPAHQGSEKPADGSAQS